ncbi:MAG: hypothetical protein JNM31_07665 [Flavobacteriales bacterium]|nr:hypothetical protein [Flavobacteriales bacterium]
MSALELHKPDEEGFIPGIHNYCDRWCERCRFVAQCRVGIEELDAEEGGFKERTAEESMAEVRQNFMKTMEMLRKMAAEQGIDLDAIVQDEKEVEREKSRRERRREKVDEHPLSKLTMDYAVKGHCWSREQREAMREVVNGWAEQARMGIEPEAQLRKAEQVSSALEVIERHAMLVASKTNRAIMGRVEDRGIYDEEVGPWQTDANGSAKLAILLMEESLAAWTLLLEHMPQFTDGMLPFLGMLAQGVEWMRKEFPDAVRFIRPGFDAPQN